jgi:MscS family membrane protein
VTGFLEACQGGDYQKASQYLDLHAISPAARASEGVQLARELEAILDSDSAFNALRLSQSPQGNLEDDADASIEHVTTVKTSYRDFTLELHLVALKPGTEIWLFTPATVAAIPDLTPSSTQSALEARLPRYLVRVELLGTPLWKWIGLLLLALLVIGAFRFAARIFDSAAGRVAGHLGQAEGWMWLHAVLEPLLVFLFVLFFAVGERWIDPSALSRLYIGRALLLIVVSSIAWGVINLIDMFLRRLNSVLDAKQRVVSHSLLYLGRRVARAIVVISAAIMVLSNWGYDMNTIIAGLGVGGIAIALAAQQTIANVFGGVSVIGDNPVMVGDFGNFGGLLGTIEDIGMRSTRVRTLSRTVVSIPNAAFAGMNLENYALRDKILFNPTLQMKRASPKDQIRRCMSELAQMLAKHKAVELGPTPVRISSYNSAAFGVEIFAYVLTDDIDAFYKVEAELFLAIDDVVTASGVELA